MLLLNSIVVETGIFHDTKIVVIVAGFAHSTEPCSIDKELTVSIPGDELRLRKKVFFLT